MAHVLTPVYREGYSLTTSAVVASSLGVVFWIVAARRYPPAVVGINAAAISALTLTGGVAQLLLMGPIVRFAPRAGRATRRLVTTSYVVCVGLAAVSAMVVLTGSKVFAPQLHQFLYASAAMAIGFVAASVVWSVAGLQDFVLMALQRAIWVPVDNAIFAVTKIIMVVGLASMMPRYGIFVSWEASALISVAVINSLLFVILIPRHSKDDQAHDVDLRSMVSFAGPDYLGSLLWLAGMTLAPIIVTQTLGPTANAFYALPWLMTILLYSVPMGTGTAFLVATAREPSRLGEYLRGVFVQTMYLVVPAAALLALTAPYVLRLFGPEYAQNSSLTLEILALSAIPCACTLLALNAARVRRRMRRTLMIRSLQSLPALALMTPLLYRYGIEGGAAAWLICQSLLAVGLLLFDRESVVGTRSRRDDSAGMASTPKPGLTLHFFAGIRFARDIAVETRVLGAASRFLDAGRMRRRDATVQRVLPSIISTLAASGSEAVPRHLAMLSIVPTDGDRAIALVGDSDGPVMAVKIAETRSATAALDREADTLRLLHSDPRFFEWNRHAPRLLGSGQVDGHAYTAETAIDGWGLHEFLSSLYAVDALGEAVNTIHGFHAAAASLREVDSELLDLWVDGPIHELSDTLMHSDRASAWASRVLEQELRQRIRRLLAGKEVDVGLIHGDFVPRNILVSPSLRVEGVVDWEQAEADRPVRLDLFMLLLSVRMLQQRRELGHVLMGYINTGGLTSDELAWLQWSEPADRELEQGLALLSWLYLISRSARKSTKLISSKLWLNLNVYPVLASIDE